ncbi:MAG: AraC family transcriptional regulator [Cyclobacteriaceae bacterium]|nr:AraC family transcriptional regulator [Cyclobacteriaceae bacterium]
MALPKKILARQHQITEQYLHEVDQHLRDFLAGREPRIYEIRDFAERLHIHPTHLSNTLKLTTGNHPCFYLEEKLIAVAKKMLEENELSIQAIADKLTFDPSNFTKFFKRFTGFTPKQYRQQQWANRQPSKTETVTI